MNTGLLVIDMQEGFRYPETESIIPIIEKVVHSFQGVTIASQFIDVPGSMFETQLNWTPFQDVDNQKIMKEFNNSLSAIFPHETYNPISEELLRYITENNINTIYLAGIYTDVSIAIAAMTLFDHSIETFVIEDCCNSVHQNQVNNIHESAIESLSHILGKDHIVKSVDVI